MRKKLLITILAVAVILLLLFIFRTPLLRSGATMLMHQDGLQKADAVFVLSGGGYDRGNEAVKVFNAGYAPLVICTGGNPVVEMKVFSIDTLESDMTVANLKRQQLPDSCIVQIKYGTSTREEADTILSYSQQHGFKKIIVLSSLLHTARVNKVFGKKFKDSGIQLLVHGAPSSRFNEMEWWKDEEGLISVNNEWIKTLYYWWKY